MNGKTYLVEDFLKQHGDKLGLRLLSGQEGLKRPIRVPEVHRPGLALSGYLKGHIAKRMLIFGKTECSYLQEMTPELRVERLESLLSMSTPAIIISKKARLIKELVYLSDKYCVPLFQSCVETTKLLNLLTWFFEEDLAQSMSCHGTLVEVFGVGVLIQGASSVGKSEAALGLIKRGHRLISDDIVMVKKRTGSYLEGSGAELTRHHMEIRGIGIINVANLFGAVCVRDRKSLDLAVKLEVWDEEQFYDRVGLDENFCEMLGVKLPLHILPVKPGRDVVLLLETIALNHRLKEMGHHSAKDFESRLLGVLSDKSKKEVKV